MTREYTYETIRIGDVKDRSILYGLAGATDLRQELIDYIDNLPDDDPDKTDTLYVTIRISKPGGFHVGAESAAVALYVPGIQRIGIAWGAPADWLDAPTVDAGISAWLLDPTA